MKKHTLVLPVRKLVLEKKTIMKLNDAMMKKLEAGYNTTKGESANCTATCEQCNTYDGCITTTITG
jgi:hypothetical protein